MSAPLETSPPSSQAKALRRLFLILFLRGRSARALKRASAPRSIGSKLISVLIFYLLMGCLAFNFYHQPVFALSLYLHALTFVFLGMFATASAGEVLFNKEETEILLHRPIAPGVLLWAKIRVLVEVSLWLGAALNGAGFIVGTLAPNGDWRFPLVHAFSTTLESLWCTGCVVVVYQLCLRWFGRERLDSLMTASQIVVSIILVLAGQLLPQMAFGMNHLDLAGSSWWICLLPPAWFAGLDDALAGTSAANSWFLAALALGGTVAIVWFAFDKLSHDYGRGMQSMQETAISKPKGTKARISRNWLVVLEKLPPWRWWLKDPVARASFRLTTAYLLRDRDVKLRLYPGLAPMLVVPFIFLLRARTQSGFDVAFVGGYAGLVPLMGITLLQYSQQWQATDIFRAAPITGPGAIFAGSRCAVFTFLTAPVLIVFVGATLLLHRDPVQLLLLIPGIIALPVYALAANLGGKAVPLSIPTDAARSARRGISMMVVFLISMALSGLTTWAWGSEWFGWLLPVEAVIAGVAYFIMRRSLAKAPWRPLE